MGNQRSIRPDWKRERQAAKRWGAPVCGIDEAGRGPLAGPVVAAAVILEARRAPRGIDDCKKLTAARRAELAAAIKARGIVGIGIASVAEIDRLNIREASFLAMRRAALALPEPPACALVDGEHAPDVGAPAQAVIGGDGLSMLIAAASIIAKVTRDAIMAEAALAHPGYGFEQHMGYATRAHREALARLGPCPLHRKSFAPIRNMLSPDPDEGLDLVSVNLR